MNYDNYLDFGLQPKATTASWMPKPVMKQFQIGNPAMPMGDDVGRQDWLGALQGMPKYADSLAAPVKSSMFDSLSGFGKNFFGTSKDPGYGSMGIGLGLNLMGLMQSRQGLKATKEQNAFARAAHTQALDNQKQDYMNQLSRYAEASAADRGLARDSDERKQFVDRYVEDKRMKA